MKWVSRALLAIFEAALGLVVFVAALTAFLVMAALSPYRGDDESL